MPIIIVIFMYLGFIQNPAQFYSPLTQRQYQSEIQQVTSQVNPNTPGVISNPLDPNAETVNLDGTPVIIDIQQF
jgi:pSer/pThr/pTyr-binding forkhead associated (FHA) protein